MLLAGLHLHQQVVQLDRFRGKKGRGNQAVISQLVKAVLAGLSKNGTDVDDTHDLVLVLVVDGNS